MLPKYQAIYVGRDGFTKVSPEFATREAAREHLDTEVIGAGLIVRVYLDSGDVAADFRVDPDGGELDYPAEFCPHDH